MKDIYILSWVYGDNSGGGIVRAFTDLDSARDTLKMLSDHGDEGKTYTLETSKLDTKEKKDQR